MLPLSFQLLNEHTVSLSDNASSQEFLEAQKPVAVEAAKPAAEVGTQTAEGKPAIADNSAAPVLIGRHTQRGEPLHEAAVVLQQMLDRSVHTDAPYADRSHCPARCIPGGVWTAFGADNYPRVLVLHGFPGHQIQVLEEHCTENLEQ